MTLRGRKEAVQLLLFLLAPYCTVNAVDFRKLARPELQFPNVSSHVAALVAVPSECVPPGSAPALVHTRHNSARCVHCMCGAFRCLSMAQGGSDYGSSSPCRSHHGAGFAHDSAGSP